MRLITGLSIMLAAALAATPSAAQERLPADANAAVTWDTWEQQPAAAAFPDYVFMFCVKIGQLGDGETVFIRDLMMPMERAAAQMHTTVYDMLMYPGCEPLYIGGTVSPMVHIMTENTTDYLQFLIFLKNYFVDTLKRPDLFLRVINAKSSRGKTALDYIQEVMGNHRYMLAEAPGLSRFIAYMCANGARYAVTANASCRDLPTTESIQRRLQ